MREALRAFGCGALQRFIDRAAIDELPAQDTHRLQGGPADDRLAQPVYRALERRAHAFLRFFRTLEHFASKHEREGGRIDEGGRTFAHVLRPVDIADLVADQCIGGGCIGHAQQRFGEAHQRHAFFCSKAILMQECIDAAGFATTRALNQLAGKGRSFRMVGFGVGGLFHTLRNAGILFRAIGFTQSLSRDGGKAGRIVQGHATPVNQGWFNRATWTRRDALSSFVTSHCSERLI